jgi:hypothetical protein
MLNIFRNKPTRYLIKQSLRIKLGFPIFVKSLPEKCKEIEIKMAIIAPQEDILEPFLRWVLSSQEENSSGENMTSFWPLYWSLWSNITSWILRDLWIRYSRVVGACVTTTAKVAKVLGSIPASSDTVESEGRQMQQCWIKIQAKKALE